MVRQTIALSRSCFIVQKYISPLDKQKNPHLCLSFENPCRIQASPASCWLKPPNLQHFSEPQYRVPAHCSALPANARPCETFPGNTAFIYRCAPGQRNMGTVLLTGVYFSLLLLDGGVSCGCEPGTRQPPKTISESSN